MQQAKAQFSIITPVYNADRFIERCIESVQRQEYPFYEHLIIDGGSTDNTVSLVRQYMLSDTNIRLVTEKDEGVYDAMNKAILLAKGQWLYFLGGDDFFYSDKILVPIALTLSGSPAEIVYGNVWFENSARIYDGVFGIEKILKRNICHQAIFYKRSVFETMGFYNIKYKLEADYDFNLRCWIKDLVVTEFVNETIAFYSKGGISSSQKDNALIQDFPDNVTSYLFESDRSFFSKIDILSKIFRKIILRYGVTKLGSVFLKRNNFGIKILAFAWMIISLPIYLITYIIFARK